MCGGLLSTSDTGDTPLIDYARLDPAERVTLASVVASHTTLERALDWARALVPPHSVESVVTQDEYTHDVRIPYRGRYLVYDTS